MTDFTLSVTVPAPYDATLKRVREPLGDVGFGVLAEIDLAATRVEVFDPAAMTSFSPDADVAVVAADARQRLIGMLAALNSQGEEADAARA